MFLLSDSLVSFELFLLSQVLLLLLLQMPLKDCLLLLSSDLNWTFVERFLLALLLHFPLNQIHRCRVGHFELLVLFKVLMKGLLGILLSTDYLCSFVIIMQFLYTWAYYIGSGLYLPTNRTFLSGTVFLYDEIFNFSHDLFSVFLSLLGLIFNGNILHVLIYQNIALIQSFLRSFLKTNYFLIITFLYCLFIWGLLLLQWLLELLEVLEFYGLAHIVVSKLFFGIVLFGSLVLEQLVKIVLSHVSLDGILVLYMVFKGIFVLIIMGELCCPRRCSCSRH